MIFHKDISLALLNELFSTGYIMPKARAVDGIPKGSKLIGLYYLMI